MNDIKLNTNNTTPSQNIEVGNTYISNDGNAKVVDRKVGSRHILDFILPRGEKGMRGYKGRKGDSIAYIPILDNIALSFPLNQYAELLADCNRFFETYDYKQGANVLIPYGGTLKGLRFLIKGNTPVGITVSTIDRNGKATFIDSIFTSKNEYILTKTFKLVGLSTLNICFFGADSYTINGGLLLKLK